MTRQDIFALTQSKYNIEKEFNKIVLNMEENAQLTQLRDTLLPKLMNGEIDVDKVEV